MRKHALVHGDEEIDCAYMWVGGKGMTEGLYLRMVGKENRKEDSQHLRQQVQELRQNRLIVELLEATSTLVLVLNRHRQILYTSSHFRKLIGEPDEAELLGLRPGDALKCIRVNESQNGCGGSGACRYCVCLHLILSAMEMGESKSGEAVIQQLGPMGERSLNIMEHVVPAQLFDEPIYIVTFMDVSDKLHRRWMEKLFFHDLINRMGALSNYLKMMKKDAPEGTGDDLAFLEASFRDVLVDVQAQKLMFEAESGELQTEWVYLKPANILNNLLQLYRKHDLAAGKELISEVEAPEAGVRADYLLLHRVLENMLRNALEATSPGQKVRAGCRRITMEGEPFLEMWIQNAEVMKEDVRSHVFQRSFSTKGINRGLGTYSMKLFGERILGGTVGFQSEQGLGTAFYFRLPIACQEEG